MAAYFRSALPVALVVMSSAFVSAAPAHADPLPAFCAPPALVDNVCTVRLASVTANVSDGTITGSPVGGGQEITLSGPAEAYQKSSGFDDAPPPAIQEWDTTIDGVNALSVDPSDPNWYGNAKAKAFLSRTLNGVATQFPPDTLVVGFTADGAMPGWYGLVSIQPTAP